MDDEPRLDYGLGFENTDATSDVVGDKVALRVSPVLEHESDESVVCATHDAWFFGRQHAESRLVGLRLFFSLVEVLLRELGPVVYLSIDPLLPSTFATCS